MTINFLQPLDQFEINVLYSFPFLGIVFSNATVYLILTCFSFSVLLLLSTFRALVVPSHFQIFSENLYRFIFSIIRTQLGSHYLRAQQYFPFLFFLFIFLLTANLTGMTAFGFTITTHVAITFSLSLSIFIGLTTVGIVNQKADFINLFIPSGVPTVLLPFLCVIEVISYVSRAFSLAIRLFSNLTSGHTLLNILSSFAFILSKKFVWLAFATFAVILVITVLEVFIAALQAYAFLVLTTIYLNDSFGVEH